MQRSQPNLRGLWRWPGFKHIDRLEFTAFMHAAVEGDGRWAGGGWSRLSDSGSFPAALKMRTERWRREEGGGKEGGEKRKTGNGRRAEEDGQKEVGKRRRGEKDREREGGANTI
jgi:hypothetical protein